MRKLVTAILLAGAIPAMTFAETDKNDHAALCAELAETHGADPASNLVANCPCSMAELQKTMPADLYEITVKWQLDPDSLPDLLPTGTSTAVFYEGAHAAFDAAESVCGPMR